MIQGLKNKFFAGAILAVVFFGLPTLISSQAAEEFGEATPQASSVPEVEALPPVTGADALYLFSEHLFGAEAVTFADRGEVSGEWQQNRFAFSGFTPKANIRLIAPILENGSSVIECNPLPRAVRRLTFYDAAPGGRLILHYRLSQEKQTKENNYMTLTVWAGQHQIRRMRFAPSPKKLWQDEVIDLGVASFFNRAIPITFEIGMDPSGLLVFKWLAEIKR